MPNWNVLVLRKLDYAFNPFPLKNSKLRDERTGRPGVRIKIAPDLGSSTRHIPRQILRNVSVDVTQ